MRAPCRTPPRHMGNGSGNDAYWRASMGSRHLRRTWMARAYALGLRIAALGDPLEQHRGQVALGGVREHGENHRALGSLAGDLESGCKRRARGNAAENALAACEGARGLHRLRVDRKSTRLNSSHLVISYAVFCLKKKKKTIVFHKYDAG